MSETPFNTKCDILGALWESFRHGTTDEGWAAFVKYYDLSLPLAVAFANDMATPTEDGTNIVLEAWDVACQMLDIPNNEEYADYEAFMNASPNELLFND